MYMYIYISSYKINDNQVLCRIEKMGGGVYILCTRGICGVVVVVVMAGNVSSA